MYGRMCGCVQHELSEHGILTRNGEQGLIHAPCGRSVTIRDNNMLQTVVDSESHSLDALRQTEISRPILHGESGDILECTG